MIKIKTVKTKRKANILLFINLIMVVLMMVLNVPYGIVAKGEETVNYSIQASDKPYKNHYVKLNTYNEKTRQYYLFRSYLEQLEKTGGGTITLSKGTYVITNTLYVPSNVTIILKDGVILKKGNTTGTAQLSPGKSLFQLISPSKSAKSNEAAKYNGESGIRIIGEGAATIDLNYVKDSVAIVMGHNDDITIQGVTFQKMQGGNFIKIGASRNVRITNNIFRYHKDSDTKSKEALALEVPDSKTKLFSYAWSKNDKTINQNIIIEKNQFNNLERAIGSTKYTQDKYHKNVSIINNKISKIDSHAVRILNWENCIVTGNVFSDITAKDGSLKAVLISGGKYPTVTKNTFSESDRAIQIMPWRNSNNGKEYSITYNVISSKNKSDMLKNTLVSMGEYIIRYNKKFNEFTQNTEKWEIYDSSVKDFTITETSGTFQKNFVAYSTYNSKTRQYYVLRSYLEQLEKVGGGTLTLKAGTYEISNTLYVPSHVTIYFQDGVVLKKTDVTGIDNMKSAKSLFQLVSPSKSTVEGAYGGYNGETDIRFEGSGTVILDMNYVQDAIGIILGHNTNVEIRGITFQNMYSGHFIELDASNNITIENNTFTHHRKSDSGIKEAINLDTPDKSTEGFHEVWTKYDATPNKDILIQNNIFNDVERSIGTHKYSQGKYHENVQILNNEIKNTTSDAIRIINWSKPVIKGNVIQSVAGGAGTFRGILASGIIHPVITENTFRDAARSIQIMPWKNSGPGSQYEITYNELNQDDIKLMLNNKLINVGESFIRINKVYNVYDSNTDKYYINE